MHAQRSRAVLPPPLLPRGATPHTVAAGSYMEKLAVGPDVDPRRISLDYSVAHNLEAIANCLGKPVR